MIKCKKKFILLLSILAVTVSAPIYANAAENISTDSSISVMAEQKDFINNQGKIENAIFYQDGRYLYSGCKAINDKEGLYYNDGNKDKFLGDYDASDIRVFGTKYTVVSKAGEEVLVDLSTGEIVNDETLADKMSSISSAVKDQISGTDRYGNFNDDVQIKELGMNRYMDPMYQYFAVPTEDSQGNSETAYIFDDGELKTGLFGFTNEDGDYIDITKTANIYAYSSKLNSICKIDKYNELDEESGLEVKLTGQAKPLCEDENYLYVMVGVSIKDTESTSSINGTTVYAFIQKISKQSGEQFDGAYLPKSVESYEVTSQYNFSDSEEPNNSIYNLAVLASVKNPDYNRAPFNAACSVKDGYIYVTQINNDKNKVKVNKIKLSNEQVVYNEGGMKLAGSMDIGYRSPAANDAGSFNTNVAEIESASAEQAINKFDNYSPVSVSTMQLAMILAGYGSSPAVFPDLPSGSVTIDNDGNIWALNNGNIMKYSESDNKFKTVYTCDNSMNKVKVYDENNIIIWNEANDIYAVIKDGQYKEDVKDTSSDDKDDPEDSGKVLGTITIDGIVYNLYSDHAEAIDYNGWTSTIDIPAKITAEGKEYTVTKICDNTFDYSTSVVNITIPDTVTSIGKEAFLGCPALQNVSMGANVKTIAENAFKSCVSLKSIKINDKAVSIGNNAFDGCSSLADVTIGASVTTIGTEAFKYCTSLKKVSMGDSVTEIGNGAFAECHSLVDIKLSNNITTINPQMFKSCRTLGNITIPNKVVLIGTEAFDDCQSLKSLIFPSSVVTIEKDAISNYNTLTKIVIPKTVTDIKEGAFERQNSNESTIFWVGSKEIKDALLRDGVKEYKIKFIGSGSSSGSSSSDKEDETDKDTGNEGNQGNTGNIGDTSGSDQGGDKVYAPKWDKNTDGKWSYYDSLGQALKDKWVNDNGNWYYLDSEGYMAVGWTKLNGYWYYLNNNGSMKTGWLKDNEQWYYLTNDGVLRIGWINTGDNWYYLSEDGSMLYNTSVDGYYLDETGAWVR